MSEDVLRLGRQTTRGNNTSAFGPGFSFVSVVRDDHPHIFLYDKRGDITQFQFLRSYIPSLPPYDVFISQFIRHVRSVLF